MDIDIARHVMRRVFLSARELEALIPLLKEHCDSEDYATYGKGVAMVLATMSTELTGKILADSSGAKQEIDADIAKYGRYL